MEFVVLRKLIAGILILLVASGVIKWRAVEERAWLRTALFVAGGLLVVFALLYQFDVIPESSTDALLK